jgi:hypothetical protein
MVGPHNAMEATMETNCQDSLCHGTALRSSNSDRTGKVVKRPKTTFGRLSPPPFTRFRKVAQGLISSEHG